MINHDWISNEQQQIQLSDDNDSSGAFCTVVLNKSSQPIRYQLVLRRGVRRPKPLVTAADVAAVLSKW